ncbi:plastocyanin/azurin family copper-binding protein [Nocardia sp. NPDC052566]|uniref:cupredoxin domain-containing protein n=1 Tax=Nocardia sp. NPDC052566 TaxID=3364330 RepID=UPI0037C5E353
MTRNALARGTFGILAAASLIILPACGSSSTPSAPSVAAPAGAPGAAATVHTKLLKFEPEKLTVKVGTTVTWEVPDSLAHTVTTGKFTLGGDGLRTSENPDGVIDKPLRKGQNVTHTFDKPGTYTYYCSIHKGMRGEVTVTA